MTDPFLQLDVLWPVLPVLWVARVLPIRWLLFAVLAAVVPWFLVVFVVRLLALAPEKARAL